MRTNSRLAASLREDHALEQEKRIGTLTEERIAGAWPLVGRSASHD